MSDTANAPFAPVLLLLLDVGLGVLLVIGGLYWIHRRDAKLELGSITQTVLASFGLATLIGEGLVPGFWMLVGYALYDGHLEDHLLPGASVGNLLRSLAAGLVISFLAATWEFSRLSVGAGGVGSTERSVGEPTPSKSGVPPAADGP